MTSTEPSSGPSSSAPLIPDLTQYQYLAALQKKSHIYAGTALPKDPKRRAKRLKQLERNGDR